MRENLKETIEEAQKNVSLAQKKWYNNNAQMKCFAKRDKVFVLLWCSNKKLQSKYKVPMLSMRKQVHACMLNGKRKNVRTYHVNHQQKCYKPFEISYWTMQFQSISTETELVVNEPDQGQKIELDVQKKFKMWSYPSDEKPTSANTGYTSCIYKCASFLRLPRFRFLSFRFGFNVGFRFGSSNCILFVFHIQTMYS